MNRVALIERLDKALSRGGCGDCGSYDEPKRIRSIIRRLKICPLCRNRGAYPTDWIDTDVLRGESARYRFGDEVCFHECKCGANQRRSLR